MSERWEGIERPYDDEAVEKLRGTVRVEHTLARNGAEKLWNLLHDRPYVAALGASTGNQAVQQVRAGLEAIYLSGWQVAADANLARQMYPDQGLYPVNSVPEVVRAINAALLRADQIDHADGNDEIDWMVPIVADMEAGFGGHLNVFELDQGDDRRRAPRACTSRTSSPPRRSAGTWAARCCCRPRGRSATSSRRGWPPTSAACRR